MSSEARTQCERGPAEKISAKLKSCFVRWGEHTKISWEKREKIVIKNANEVFERRQCRKTSYYALQWNSIFGVVKEKYIWNSSSRPSIRLENWDIKIPPVTDDTQRWCRVGFRKENCNAEKNALLVSLKVFGGSSCLSKRGVGSSKRWDVKVGPILHSLIFHSKWLDRHCVWARDRI